MAAVWTSAISQAWTVVYDLMGGFLPVIAVGLGLAILGGLFAAFSGRAR